MLAPDAQQALPCVGVESLGIAFFIDFMGEQMVDCNIRS
jgi:hypothetical protein